MLPVTCIDTETELIRPGLLAPPLVCMSYVDEDSEGLWGHQDTREFFVRLLQTKRMIIGHNIAYDLAVCAAEWPDLLPTIFRAYEDDRISDTLIREKLIHIGLGMYRKYQRASDLSWVKLEYSLEAITSRRLKVQLIKGDWQLRFSELKHKPVADWPEAARHYAITDALATMAVWEDQEDGAADYLRDEHRQTRAAWWIHLMSCWGLHTDRAGVEAFADKVQKSYDSIAKDLLAAGLLKSNGVRDTKAAAARMQQVLGDRVEKTETGKISLSSDSCTQSKDPILIKYAELSSLKKKLSTDVPLLLQGIKTPIQARFETLLETGRTSSSPNVQNLPTEEGVRECFVPRRGRVFASADFSGFELRTMSQVCIKQGWDSKLAKALNAGNDPHLEVARRILNISYEEAKSRIHDDDVHNARQAGKVANFGFPGGLGYTRFVDYARQNYGITVTEKQARELKDFWLQSWPEFNEYFRWIGGLCEQNTPQICHVFSHRYRGGISFTEACNSFFQGLAADAAKNAGFLISQACYVDESSPLFGSRIVNFVHDEFIVEVPDDDRASDAAEELANLMVLGASPFLPDVPPLAEPQLMRRWSKKAKAVRDANGRLIPWE